MINCQTYYLPQKFASDFLFTTAIPLDVNSNNALQELYEVINSHVTKTTGRIFLLLQLVNLIKLT